MVFVRARDAYKIESSVPSNPVRPQAQNQLCETPRSQLPSDDIDHGLFATLSNYLYPIAGTP